MQTAATSSAAASAATTTQTSSAINKLSGNFDNFLKLLTLQLQHQDPLSPMDATQFTTQLVQFSGVEQAITENQKLDQLIALQSGTGTLDALGYLGRQVDADSDHFQLTEDGGDFTYSLAGNAAASGITVLDSSGKTVWTHVGEPGAGSHTVHWDGTGDDGSTEPPGKYTVRVAAVDKDGKPVGASTGTTGLVTGVTMRDGQIILDLGGIEVAASSVHAVRVAPPAENG